MQILLPPSETKRTGGDARFDAAMLTLRTELDAARAQVRVALESVSRDEPAAVKALKLGVKNRDERLHNLEFDGAAAMPAIERYTGVLYDALDAHTLDAAARRWIDAHVWVQSALFGLLRSSDLIPAYRLSGSSRLPELGSPLARVWARPHAEVLSDSPYVLDLRSKDYAGLAPVEVLGADSYDTVEVVARSADGQVRALNHFNKAAKGDLVRRLAVSGAHLASRDDLLAWAAREGIELAQAEQPHTLRLVTKQGVPASGR